MLTKGIFAALLIAVEFLAVIASVAALIWGLVGHRRRLWRGAIVSVVLSLLLLAGSSVWAAVKVFHAAKREVGRTFVEFDETRQGSPARMREWYEDITQIKLPPDAVYVNGRCIDEMMFSNYFLQFTVPADYQATFDAKLQHVT
jgi:hypothetical protein